MLQFLKGSTAPSPGVKSEKGGEKHGGQDQTTRCEISPIALRVRTNSPYVRRECGRVQEENSSRMKTGKTICGPQRPEPPSFSINNPQRGGKSAWRGRGGQKRKRIRKMHSFGGRKTRGPHGTHGGKFFVLEEGGPMRKGRGVVDYNYQLQH